jgi:predicted naringenin-chalcone synthase
LTNNDIRHWAIHPGGDKILSTVQKEMKFSDDVVSQARAVLARYGNMSSPTVLFVLKNIMDSGIKSGEYCMMVAFGAGFSVHAYLLKVL